MTTNVGNDLKGIRISATRTKNEANDLDVIYDNNTTDTNVGEDLKSLFENTSDKKTVALGDKFDNNTVVKNGGINDLPDAYINETKIDNTIKIDKIFDNGAGVNKKLTKDETKTSEVSIKRKEIDLGSIDTILAKPVQKMGSEDVYINPTKKGDTEELGDSYTNTKKTVTKNLGKLY